MSTWVSKEALGSKECSHLRYPTKLCSGLKKHISCFLIFHLYFSKVPNNISTNHKMSLSEIIKPHKKSLSAIKIN